MNIRVVWESDSACHCTCRLLILCWIRMCRFCATLRGTYTQLRSRSFSLALPSLHLVVTRCFYCPQGWPLNSIRAAYILNEITSSFVDIEFTLPMVVSYPASRPLSCSCQLPPHEGLLLEFAHQLRCLLPTSISGTVENRLGNYYCTCPLPDCIHDSA